MHVSDTITLVNVMVLKELFHDPASKSRHDEVSVLNHLMSVHHH